MLTYLKSRRFKLELWGVRLVALLTLLMGLVNLISAVTPALSSRLTLLETVLPLEVRHGSRLTSALAGFALFLLASNLWRRKHTAWLLTAILIAITLVSHLLKGLDFEEASLALVLLALLLVLRRSFHAYTDPPSMRQALRVLVAAFAFTLVYGSAGFYVLDRHFNIQFGLLSSLRQTVVMFTSFYDPGLTPLTRFGRYFVDSIYVVGVSTLSYALVMLVRPVLVRRPATPSERARAEQIVTQFGRTALARPTLLDDKSYFFTPGGSMVAFVARGRGAMALGDLIGAPEDAAAGIATFKAYCVGNGWQPSFLCTMPDYLPHYRAAGFDTLCLGYEAIVPLASFTLDGSENKSFRVPFNKLNRLGFRTELYEPPIADAILNQLRLVSDAWLSMQSGGEMHFAMGWFDDEYVRGSRILAVHSPASQITAFVNLVGEYQHNEVTVDLMRRLPQVEGGTMDLLFVAMLQWAKQQGYDTFSLGLSSVIGVGEKSEDPRAEKALHTIAETVSRFYNFKGLHTFKEKFHPRWEPRYLAYPGAASLPLVLATLLRVHSGDNFLWRYIHPIRLIRS
jgi:phosphatidylglycerol lysyltransferase